MFQRKKDLPLGWNPVEVLEAKLMEISNKREALRLVVRSTNGDIGSYLIFTDRIDLINKLISCVWEEYDEDFVDENEFVGVPMSIHLVERKGHVIISDIMPIEEATE